eukprot:gb/GEZN01000175.1/.p1 GENE.gb/GEZN01000175.1/~~gb/GEZN01000175.1/.p1  ORF type:complete len:1996 (-),score=145.76 gb/GEZN01000175.1/:103-6012(-)
MTDASGPSWNMAPPCSSTIDEQNSRFSVWRKNERLNKAAIWKLQTDCWGLSTVVGLAYVGRLCRDARSVGVTTYTASTWLTFAHEVGHLFGAVHSFQLGKGTTGGIMDYGNGQLDGEYQFYTQYCKTDVCTQIKEAMYQTKDVCEKPGVTGCCDCLAQSICWKPYAPVCGDGVWDYTEECDDGNNNGQSTSCCGIGCVLKPGAGCFRGECCSNCQPLLGTTTCGSGNGYCDGNGKCYTATICSKYKFSFCGITADDPCHTGCNYSGRCITFPNPPYNDNGKTIDTSVQDGTLCVLSGKKGTCQTGTCQVAQVPPTKTHEWATNSYTACTATCGNSATRSRKVWCREQVVLTEVPDSNCDAGTKPASIESCTGLPLCPNYGWTYSPWLPATCPVDCTGYTVSGSQSRSAVCVDFTTQTTQTSNVPCAGISQQQLTQACNSNVCLTSWSIGQWSACSRPCGFGIQTRTTSCCETQNSVLTCTLPTYRCSNPPTTQQSCNTQACPAYAWYYLTWGACSTSCGSGTQTREIACRETSTLVIQPTSFCTQVPEATSRSCNTEPCVSYSWQASPWSSCSVACGVGGTKERTVYCKGTSSSNPGGSIVASELCRDVGAAPVSIQNCVQGSGGDVPYCAVWAWTTEPWGSCTAECNGGTHTRPVYCKNINVGSEVDSSGQACSPPKPAVTEQCNVQKCKTYAWNAGDWGGCSVLCGADGTQTRTVSCVLEGGNGDRELETLCTAAKPDSSRACQPTPPSCAINYLWSAKSWGVCSRSCGSGGIRTREVWCVAEAERSVRVQDSLCDASGKPSQNEPCNTQSCPAKWYSSPVWSDCSLPCGTGSQTTVVTCQDENGVVQPDNACTASKPSTVRPCNTQPCPSWAYSEWSPCYPTCGQGTQNRTAQCLNYLNQPSPNEKCPALPANALRQICNNPRPCPYWRAGDWKDCSEVCGNAGVSQRDVVCQLPNGAPWNGEVLSVNQCDFLPKPPTTQSCNRDKPCPTYFYRTFSWSTCAVSCGGSTQYRTVECYSDDEKQVALDPKLCFGTPPSKNQPCNTQPCPVYYWWADEAGWGPCNSDCGPGAIDREIQCRQNLSSSFRVVEASFCSNLIPPPYSKPCELNQTCGAFGNCTDEHCRCVPGWGGILCTVEPKLVNVSTNIPKQFAEGGLPFGEMVSITWESQGNLPSVYLLLEQIEWVTPHVIQKNLVNQEGSNAFLWKFNLVLPAGNNYSVVVWFNDVVYARSAQFKVADGHLYANCGAQGVAQYDGSCRCLGGWSGPRCGTSPCQALACHSAGSTCDQLSGNASCKCLAGYTGPRCYTPMACADSFQCNNSGTDFLGISSTAGDDCAALTCNCLNDWTGNMCNECNLQCANGFRANLTTCAECVCGGLTGWTNTKCDCQYYIFQLLIPAGAVAEALAQSLLNASHDSPEWIRFQNALKGDLTNSLGLSDNRVQSIRVFQKLNASTNLTDGNLYIEFWALDDCIFVDGGRMLGDYQHADHIDNQQIGDDYQGAKHIAIDLHLNPSTYQQSKAKTMEFTKTSDQQSETKGETARANTQQFKENEGGRRRSMAADNTSLQQNNSKNETNPNLQAVYANMQEQIDAPYSTLKRGVISRYCASYLYCLNCPQKIETTEAPPLPPPEKSFFQTTGWKILAGGLASGLCCAAALCVLGFRHHKQLEEQEQQQVLSNYKSGVGASGVNLQVLSGGSSRGISASRSGILGMEAPTADVLQIASTRSFGSGNSSPAEPGSRSASYSTLLGQPALPKVRPGLSLASTKEENEETSSLGDSYGTGHMDGLHINRIESGSSEGVSPLPSVPSARSLPPLRQKMPSPSRPLPPQYSNKEESHVLRPQHQASSSGEFVSPISIPPRFPPSRRPPPPQREGSRGASPDELKRPSSWRKWKSSKSVSPTQPDASEGQHLSDQSQAQQAEEPAGDVVEYTNDTEGPLPMNWSAVVSPQGTYYYNQVTGETTWDSPS